MPPQLKLHTHFTKSPKPKNFYKLRLWTAEEHNCIILTSMHDPKLRYGASAKKCKPFLHCTVSLEHDDIEVHNIIQV